MFYYKNHLCHLSIWALILIPGLSGCARSEQAPPPPVPVKTVLVIQRDTAVANDYAGQIQGENEVRVQARVAGNIVEKLITGGQEVQKGQPLFKLDDRLYMSALLSARAQLANSEAVLTNTRLDTQRYQELFKASAIAEQMLTTQETLERQQRALVDYNRALVQKAQDDLDDTVVTSPIDGRLYVDDVSVGTYVQPGISVLVTVGAVNPVYAVFNMSETEYLTLRQTYKEELTAWGNDIAITLSSGEPYPLKGKVTQIDRALGNGTLTVKASIPNPDGLLIPGMFARIKITGQPRQDALLIPQRAVQQVLDKSYVMVVDKDNKVTAKQVVLGQKSGSFQIVETGLVSGETIVVEGLARIREGVAVSPEQASPKELNLTFE